MAKFTDAKGREWLVSITTGGVKAVRQQLNVDLVDLNQSTMDRLATDFVMLVDVLWVLCEQQAANKQPPVSAEDFGEALVGDPIEAATTAIVEAFCNFFPAGRRLLLQTANAKTTQVRRKAEELALAKLTSLDLTAFEQATEKRLEAEIQNALTRLNSATS